VDLENSLSRFYKYLTDGKETSLRQLFSGPFALNSPLSGSLNGSQGLQSLLENEGSWMRRHLISVEKVSTMRDQYRIAVELKLIVKINGNKTDLPVILIGDLYESKFGQVRIYHSTWPINGAHSYRAPIIWPRASLHKPEVIQNYTDCLNRGDAEGILKLFTEDASVQEPSGDPFVHKGSRERKEFFTGVFSDGPPGITHVADIRTEEFYCVEYICESWGKMIFPPMAGCTVYALSHEEDRISQIRVYDDITIPDEETDVVPL